MKLQMIAGKMFKRICNKLSLGVRCRPFNILSTFVIDSSSWFYEEDVLGLNSQEMECKILSVDEGKTSPPNLKKKSIFYYHYGVLLS